MRRGSNIGTDARSGPATIAYVVTAPRQSVRLFLRGHLSFMRRSGFKVYLIAPPGKDLQEAASREGVETISVPIERDIAPVKDLRTLFRLVAALQRIRPDVVNAGTPKAGFLGMLAALLVGVPVRVYHLRALRLETTRGWRHRLLLTTEAVASACSSRIVGISASLADRFVELRLAPRHKLVVFGNGSSNGIDIGRFQPDEKRRELAANLRRRLGFDESDVVVGFVGRLIPDKGIVDLLGAFQEALASTPALRLLLVGSPEPHHRFGPGFMDQLRSHPRVKVIGYQDETAPYYHAMDIFAFPSHREGFGNAALEAAAAGLPVVGFRVTGVVDAVDHDRTGTLVTKNDVEALSKAIVRYARSERLRSAHGQAGMRRARTEFEPRRIWEEFVLEYRRLIDAARSTC